MSAEVQEVRVTAADFNGSTFDGSPFEPVTAWLREAIEAGRIECVADDRDYAVWDVKSGRQGWQRAEPDDRIVRWEDGTLSVSKRGGAR